MNIPRRTKDMMTIYTDATIRGACRERGERKRDASVAERDAYIIAPGKRRAERSIRSCAAAERSYGSGARRGSETMSAKARRTQQKIDAQRAQRKMMP
jgi:hypothetical protein